MIKDSVIFERLAEHLNHNIVVVGYGDEQAIDNISIECSMCDEVLVDFEPDNEEGG